MQKRKRDSVPLLSYRYGKLIKFFAYSFFTLLLMIMLFTFYYVSMRDNVSLGCCGAPLTIVIYALFCMWTHRELKPRIDVYEDGIELVQGQSYVFVPWEDMVQFEKMVVSSGSGRSISVKIYHGIGYADRNRPKNHPIGLPRESKNFLRLNWFFLRIPLKRDPWWGDAKINSQALSTTEFGKVLLANAPQLFEREAFPKKNM